MTPFDAYVEYNALKNHFNKPEYDYIKYNGKIRASQVSFDKRPDKVFFQKLAKHEDLKNFLIANLVFNNKAFSRTLAYSKECEQIYIDWKSRQQSLSHIFTQDLETLNEDYKSNFIIEKNQHPIIMKKLLGGEISIESFSVLINLSSVIDTWDKEMPYDIIWDAVKLKATRYLPFIDYDRKKFKQIVLDKFFSS